MIVSCLKVVLTLDVSSILSSEFSGYGNRDWFNSGIDVWGIL